MLKKAKIADTDHILKYHILWGWQAEKHKAKLHKQMLENILLLS